MTAYILYFRAIKAEELSRVVPLFHLTPIFTLFLAVFFLGEVLAPLKYLGTVLVVAGAALISVKKMGLSFGRSSWMMVMAAALLSVYYVIMKHLLDFAGYWTVFSYIRLGTVFILPFILYFSLSDLKASVRRHGKRVVGMMSLNEAFNLGALLSITVAASLGFVTLVNALS